jgi:hypothetical protein
MGGARAASAAHEGPSLTQHRTARERAAERRTLVAARVAKRRYVPDTVERKATLADYKLLNTHMPENSSWGPQILDSWLVQGLVSQPDQRAVLTRYKSRLSQRAVVHANRVRTPELARPANFDYVLKMEEAKKARRMKKMALDIERMGHTSQRGEICLPRDELPAA